MSLDQSFTKHPIENRIFTIRGVQVMIDRDLAELYQTETKYINRAVKRNPDRFPETFVFQLTSQEVDILKSQFGTSSGHGGRRTLPYAFTEQGVAMLSAALQTQTAILVSVQIMTAFVQMRKLITSQLGLFQRLDHVELKLLDNDHKFEQLFKALESKSTIPNKACSSMAKSLMPTNWRL